MNQESKQERTITIPLGREIEYLLRQDDFIEIRNEDDALIFELKLKGTTLAFLQKEDEYGIKLQYPLLWKFSSWHSSWEHRLRLKKDSEDWRLSCNLFDVNTKNLKRALMQQYKMEEKIALETAIKMCNGNKNSLKIKASFLKVKLAEKQEDLI